MDLTYTGKPVNVGEVGKMCTLLTCRDLLICREKWRSPVISATGRQGLGMAMNS
jgi:hypothetical protein